MFGEIKEPFVIGTDVIVRGRRIENFQSFLKAGGFFFKVGDHDFQSGISQLPFGVVGVQLPNRPVNDIQASFGFFNLCLAYFFGGFVVDFFQDLIYQLTDFFVRQLD